MMDRPEDSTLYTRAHAASQLAPNQRLRLDRDPDTVMIYRGFFVDNGDLDLENTVTGERIRVTEDNEARYWLRPL